MCAAISMLLVSSFALMQGPEPTFTSLTEEQAQQKITAMMVNGQVGGSFDFRVTSTYRSYNYKRRATWVTPSLANAAAVILPIRKSPAALSRS